MAKYTTETAKTAPQTASAQQQLKERSAAFTEAKITGAKQVNGAAALQRLKQTNNYKGWTPEEKQKAGRYNEMTDYLSGSVGTDSWSDDASNRYLNEANGFAAEANKAGNKEEEKTWLDIANAFNETIRFGVHDTARISKYLQEPAESRTSENYHQWLDIINGRIESAKDDDVRAHWQEVKDIYEYKIHDEFDQEEAHLKKHGERYRKWQQNISNLEKAAVLDSGEYTEGTAEYYDALKKAGGYQKRSLGLKKQIEDNDAAIDALHQRKLDLYMTPEVAEAIARLEKNGYMPGDGFDHDADQKLVDDFYNSLSVPLQRFNWEDTAESWAVSIMAGIGETITGTYGTLRKIGERVGNDGDVNLYATDPSQLQEQIGRYGKGNIDLYDRNTGLHDDSGLLMTVDSMSREEHGKEVLVPKVVRQDGRWVHLANDEAWSWYLKTGEYLGKFNTREEADAYANELHEQQDRIYGDRERQYIGGLAVPSQSEIASLQQKAGVEAFNGRVTDPTAYSAIRDLEQNANTWSKKAASEQQAADAIYDQLKSFTGSGEVDVNELIRLKKEAKEHEQNAKDARDIANQFGGGRASLSFAMRYGNDEDVTHIIDQISWELHDTSVQELMRAKQGKGAVGKFILDAGKTLVEMGFDSAVGAVTGTGMLTPMAVRVFGQASQEANRAGATLNQQYAYGAAKAGIEVFTEHLFGVEGMGYGKGMLSPVTEKLLNMLTKDTGRAARTMIYLFWHANEEGVEELLATLAAPLADKIYREESLRELKDEEYATLAYDYLLGVGVGILGSGGYAFGGDLQADVANSYWNELQRDSDAIEAIAEEKANAPRVGFADTVAAARGEQNEAVHEAVKEHFIGEAEQEHAPNSARITKAAQKYRDVLQKYGVFDENGNIVGLKTIPDNERLNKQEVNMLIASGLMQREMKPLFTGATTQEKHKAERVVEKSEKGTDVTRDKIIARAEELDVGQKMAPPGQLEDTHADEADYVPEEGPDNAKAAIAELNQRSAEGQQAIDEGKTDNQKLSVVVKTVDATVSTGKTLKTIRNNIFKKTGKDGEASLVDKVASWMEKNIGGSVYTTKIGGEKGTDIILNRRGIKNDIAHGVGEEKAAAFQAVPDVLRDGIIVSTTKENGEPVSYIIAGKVNLMGKPVNVYCVVKKDGSGSNRFYLHEVSDGNGNLLYQLKDDGSVKGQQESAPSTLQDPSSEQTPSAEETLSEDSIPQETTVTQEETTQQKTQRNNEDDFDNWDEHIAFLMPNGEDVYWQFGGQTHEDALYSIAPDKKGIAEGGIRVKPGIGIELCLDNGPLTAEQEDGLTKIINSFRGNTFHVDLDQEFVKENGDEVIYTIGTIHFEDADIYPRKILDKIDLEIRKYQREIKAAQKGSSEAPSNSPINAQEEQSAPEGTPVAPTEEKSVKPQEASLEEASAPEAVVQEEQPDVATLDEGVASAQSEAEGVSELDKLKAENEALKKQLEELQSNQPTQEPAEEIPINQAVKEVWDSAKERAGEKATRKDFLKVLEDRIKNAEISNERAVELANRAFGQSWVEKNAPHLATLVPGEGAKVSRPEPAGTRKSHSPNALEQKTQSYGSRVEHYTRLEKIAEKFGTDDGTFLSKTREEVSRIAKYCIKEFGSEAERERLMNTKDWTRLDFSIAGKIAYDMTMQLNKEMVAKGNRGLGKVLERRVGESKFEYQRRQEEEDKREFLKRREPIDALLQMYEQQKSEAGQKLQEQHKFTIADEIRMKSSQRLLSYTVDGEVRNDSDQAKNVKIYAIIDDLLDRAETADTNGDLAGMAEVAKLTAQIRGRENLFGRAGVKAESAFLEDILKHGEESGLNADAIATLTYGNIQKILDDLTPITYMDALNTIRMSNMLSNIATGVNNFKNNAVALRLGALSQNAAYPFAKAFEAVTGKKVAFTDTSFTRIGGGKARAEITAYEYALLSSYYGLNQEQGRLDSRSANAGFNINLDGLGGFVGRNIARYNFLVNALVLSPDAPAKARAELAMRQGIERAFEGVDMTTEMAANKKELEAYAHQETKRRTLQDDNRLTNEVVHVKKLLNKVETRGKNRVINGRQLGSLKLGDFAIAFAKVPANVGLQEAMATPFGAFYQMAKYADTLIRAKLDPESVSVMEMAKASRDMGRALTTWGMVGLGALGAMMGALKNFDDTDDDEEKKLAAEKGYKGLTFNLSVLLRGGGEWRTGDKVVSGNFLEILAMPLAIGAIMYDMSQEGIKGPQILWKGTAAGFSGAVDAVMDIPGLQQVAQIYEAYANNRNPDEDLLTKAGKAIGQFIVNSGTSYVIPNVVSQFGAGLDNKQRDIYGADTYGETLRNIVMSKIPGVRTLLPEKTDTLGNTRTYGDNQLMSIINTVLLPGDIKKYNISDLEVEMLRLKEATDYSGILFDTNAPKSIKFDDEEYSLDADNRRAYHDTKAKLLLEAYDKFRNSDIYDKLTDDQKLAVILQLRTDAERMARNGALKIAGVDEKKLNDSLDKWEQELKTWNDKIEYLTAKQITKSFWDEDKKAITDYDAMDKFIKTQYPKLSQTMKDLLDNSYSQMDDIYAASKVGINSKTYSQLKAIHDKYEDMQDYYREADLDDEPSQTALARNMIVEYEEVLSDPTQRKWAQDNMQLWMHMPVNIQTLEKWQDKTHLETKEIDSWFDTKESATIKGGYKELSQNQRFQMIRDFKGIKASNQKELEKKRWEMLEQEASKGQDKNGDGVGDGGAWAKLKPYRDAGYSVAYALDHAEYWYTNDFGKHWQKRKYNRIYAKE